MGTVRRSIIFMRDSNFIKKDEKHTPHFRRTALFPSGGGKPEGKEGEQYSHVRGRAPYFTFEPAATPQEGRGLNSSRVGEEYPNGAPRKIAAGNFVGSPGWRGNNTSMSGDGRPFSSMSPPQPPNERYMILRV